MTQRVDNIGKAYDDTIWHGSTRPGAVIAPLIGECARDAVYLYSRAINDGVHVSLDAIHNVGNPANHRTAI